MPNVSMALDIASSCKPDHKLCITIATKLSSILTNVIDLLFWVVLALLSVQFIYWIFNLIYNAFAFLGTEVSTKVSNLYQDYRLRSQMGEKGEYVRLPDGSFVLQSEYMLGYGQKDYNFVNDWLDSETTTVVRFSNAEFDYSYREMFDDPAYWKALEKLKNPDAEIIGVNDEYHDDVWSGGHSANAVDDGFDEEMNIGFGGFFDFGFDSETGEVIEDSFDDWRN